MIVGGHGWSTLEGQGGCGAVLCHVPFCYLSIQGFSNAWERAFGFGGKGQGEAGQLLSCCLADPWGVAGCVPLGDHCPIIGSEKNPHYPVFAFLIVIWDFTSLGPLEGESEKENVLITSTSS